jgi:uncharacterized repeat protein (TIGR01451 family)
MIRTLLVACSFLLFTALPAQMVVQFTITHASCGATTGSLWTQITGGTGPYTFAWSNGATTGSLNNVPPGTYTVTVTDAQANTATGTAEILLLDVLFPQFPLTAYSCNDNCSGQVQHYIPLLGNFTYTVSLDPPQGSAFANPNGLSFQGLCVGTEYTATVLRSDGCTATVGPITVVGPTQPQLLSTSITPSCPGGATGSVTLVFENATYLSITGDGIIDSLPPFTNPYTLTGLAPGPYLVYAWPGFFQGGTSCYLSFTFVIPESTEPCGLLSGTAFADVDDDCLQDAGEVGVPFKIFTVQPGDHLFITDAAGNFSTEFPYGNHTLDITFTDYASDCIPLPYAFTLDAGNVTAEVTLPLAPQFDPDVSAFTSSGVHVPGFAVNYHASITNQGPYTFTGLTLDLYVAPLLIPVSAEGSPTLVAPGHYQWTGLDLAAFQHLQFTLSFTVPPSASLLGTTVTGTATVSGNTGDAEPANDSYTMTRTIVGAFDPNDKLVQTSSQESDSQYFLDQDEWVDYTIRFQNTGTAPAINVHLLDTIAMELDLLSLQMLGSSHSFTPSILPGRVLRFDFPGIMLPDSTADLAGSQGFVSFRLKPVNGLLPGTYLVNAADIFFDFNEPIRTNDAVLVMESSTGLTAREQPALAVHPNPTDGPLNLLLPAGLWQVEVLALDGRILSSSPAMMERITLDVQGLASGMYLIRTSGTDGRVATARFVRR